MADILKTIERLNVGLNALFWSEVFVVSFQKDNIKKESLFQLLIANKNTNKVIFRLAPEVQVK